MIYGLPETIHASILDQFDLGSDEAHNDNLLDQCFCEIEPIIRFQKNRHDILVGAKGSGKSAVFRMLRDGKLDFDDCPRARSEFVCIDEKVEYESIRAALACNLKTRIDKEEIQYRFLWEVYLLFCIANKLLEGDAVPQDLRKQLTEFTGFFKAPRARTSLLNIITSTKATIGFKLDTTNPAFPAPDFYFSSEAKPAVQKQKPEMDVLTVPLDDLKRKINEMMKKRGKQLFVLVDNLDDFVAEDRYIVQKHILNGLLQCCRDYGGYSQLTLKIFIRTDLYQKLNFHLVGGLDKIDPHVVELRWQGRDIRYFMARRLAINLVRILKPKKFRVEVDHNKSTGSTPLRVARQIGRSLSVVFGMQSIDPYTSHEVWTFDRVSRDIIASLMPTQLHHYTERGKEETCDLWKYLETHFALGTGETTPRIILRFLGLLTDSAAEYYRQNPDHATLQKNEEGHYAAFKVEHILTAYSELQSRMPNVFKSWVMNEDWQKYISILFSSKGKKDTFSFRVLKNMLSIDEADEAYAFLAYMTHLGALSCKDPGKKPEQRTYQLPVLLRYNWSTLC